MGYIETWCLSDVELLGHALVFIDFQFEGDSQFRWTCTTYRGKKLISPASCLPTLLSGWRRHMHESFSFMLICDHCIAFSFFKWGACLWWHLTVLVTFLQKHAGTLLEGFTQTQISTLVVKDNFLVAGGFQGEIFCKVTFFSFRLSYSFHFSYDDILSISSDKFFSEIASFIRWSCKFNPELICLLSICMVCLARN